MPNRILKESICMSDEIDKLSSQSETLFYRLIVQTDDYGRIDARPSIIRAKCYPLKLDSVKDADICNWIIELIENNLISLYTVANKYFIQITTWDKHQQVRAKKSKYPNPEGYLDINTASDYYRFLLISYSSNCENLPAESNGNHVKSFDCNSPRNPIQSNPILIDKRNILLSETKVSDIAVRLTEKLKNLMIQNNPKVKIPKNLIKWQYEIDKMIRLDKRTEEEIENVIVFSQHNDFWKANILSGGKLREKYDTLFLQMKRNGHKESENGNNGGNHKETVSTVATDKTERLLKSWSEN